MIDPVTAMPMVLALPAYAGALAALLYIGRQTSKAVRAIRRGIHALRELLLKVDALDELARRELEHNHGSSMKDDLHGVAVSVGIVQRELADLRADFDNHVSRKEPR